MAYTFAQANARRQRLVSLARVESRLATIPAAQPPALVGDPA
jgi:hypothetical protein